MRPNIHEGLLAKVHAKSIMDGFNAGCQTARGPLIAFNCERMICALTAISEVHADLLMLHGSCFMELMHELLCLKPLLHLTEA